ncbi:transmembrane protease serine 9-like [Anopheles ziemanni]|uniref:transmembrane protease serine 9-like n=1 Tax=Anopheles coustani TaxID=139045 RepID=UPI00265AE298|nr:transmembrane protease serine 9-like [Anopheles coustani]XP_058177265.1 transmembrane protease serine 9-like [Anopheles ziemanni]
MRSSSESLLHIALLSLGLLLCQYTVDLVEPPPRCGTRLVAVPGTIVRGQPSWPGQFPWHAALYRLERAQASASYVCGCFIVGDRTLLTAAHCVTDASGFQLAASELTIRAGLHDLLVLARYSQEHQVQRIVRHGNYSLGSPRHDVALLTLRTVVEFGEFVQPICLPDGETSLPRRGIVAGWGRTEDHLLARTLRASAMPIIDFLPCLQSDPDLFAHVLYDGMFCAGWQNGTNVCNGDSGGAFVAIINGSWTAFGIVSFTGLQEDTADGQSFRCDTKSLAGFVSIPKYRHWIEHVTQREGVTLSTDTDATLVPERERPFTQDSRVDERMERVSEQRCRRYRKECDDLSQDLSYLAYVVRPDRSHFDELPQGYPRLVIDCFAVLISDRFLLTPASCSVPSNKGAAPAKQFIILEAAGRATDCGIRTFHQHPDFVNNPPAAGDRETPDQSNLALIELERPVPLSTCQFVCLWAGADDGALGQIFLYSAVNGSVAGIEALDRGHHRVRPDSPCYDELLAPMVMVQERGADGGEGPYRLVGIVLQRTCTKLRFIRVAPFLRWIEELVWGSL